MFSFKKAFTLIELLVVVAILATLAGAIIYSTDNAREKGKDARRKEDIKAVSSALVSYYADFGHYPPTTDANPIVLDYSSKDNPSNWIPDLDTYLQKQPKDPLQASLIEQFMYNIQISISNLTSTFSQQAYAHLDPVGCDSTNSGQVSAIIQAVNPPSPINNGNIINYQVGALIVPDGGAIICSAFNVDVFIKLPGETQFNTTPVCTINLLAKGNTTYCPTVPYTADFADLNGNALVANAKILGDRHWSNAGDCIEPAPRNPNSASFSCFSSSVTSTLYWTPPPPDLPGGGTESGACDNDSNSYCYRVSLDKKNFIVWAELENKNDPDIYNRTQGTATCNDDDATIVPPTGGFLNYCIRSPR